MLSLTNDHLKYLAYGVMIFIIIILLLNIFLTKINNNYNNSTFESFGNITEALDNKNNLDTVVSTTHKSHIENIKNINKKNLEKFQKILLLNEAEYLNDMINDNTKTRVDIKNLMNNEKFILRTNNVNATFEYLDHIIKNFDNSKK
tara:strand:+ start:9554 stop:9991 length:438 start_codon:yes stop_codon:yes gene_type:complete